MYIIDSGKLRKAFILCDCSISTLARRAKLNPATVAKIIDSNRPIQIHTLVKIARVLGVADPFSLAVKI